MRLKACAFFVLVMVVLALPRQALSITLSFDPPSVTLTASSTATTQIIAIKVTGTAGEQVISGQALVFVQVSGPANLTVTSLSGLTSGMIFAMAGGTQANMPVDGQTRGLMLFAPTDPDSSLPIPFVLTDGTLLNVRIGIPADTPAGTYALQILTPGMDTFFSDQVNNTITPLVTDGSIIINAPATDGSGDTGSGGDGGTGSGGTGGSDGTGSDPTPDPNEGLFGIDTGGTTSTPTTTTPTTTDPGTTGSGPDSSTSTTTDAGDSQSSGDTGSGDTTGTDSTTETTASQDESGSSLVTTFALPACGAGATQAMLLSGLFLLCFHRAKK